MAPNAAIAAIGPRKRLSWPHSFAHRLVAGLATGLGGDASSGGAESVISCQPSFNASLGLNRASVPPHAERLLLAGLRHPPFR